MQTIWTEYSNIPKILQTSFKDGPFFQHAMSVRAQCLVLLGRWTTAARAADALLENDPEFLKG